MFRHLYTCLFIVLYSTIAYSQGNIAILKFEEAEAAFAISDYTKTIRLIEEVEDLAGVTSGTLYLKIVAKDRIFNQTAKDDLQESDKKLLTELRRFTEQYLKAMENSDLNDNFRTVYNINEKLKQYTNTLPDVATVLERFYEAIGGHERIRAVQTILKRYETTTITAGISTTIKIVEKNAIAKCRWVATGDGYTSVTVFNKPSGIAYNQIDMLGGMQTKLNLEVTEGMDRRTSDSEALILGDMVQPEKYLGATIDERVLEGEEVYLLYGDQQIAAFSKDSGLLRYVVEQSIPNIEMTVFYKDYSSVSGLLLPLTIDTYSKFNTEGVENMETTSRTTYMEITVNTPFSDAEFK